MSDPVGPLLMRLEPTPSPAPSRSSADFAEHLEHSTETPAAAEPSGAGFLDMIGRMARGLSADDRRSARAMHRARRGGLDPSQLLALQSDVYRYTQQMELTSKVVDKAAQAVKTTLQSQQ